MPWWLSPFAVMLYGAVCFGLVLGLAAVEGLWWLVFLLLAAAHHWRQIPPL